MSLVAELKRRNVIRVGIAYVVVSWLAIQVAETVFPVSMTTSPTTASVTNA